MMNVEDREATLKNAGIVAAKLYGMSVEDGIQGCRQCYDAFVKAGSEGTPTDWIIGAAARIHGVTPEQVEAVAADTVRLRRR